MCSFGGDLVELFKCGSDVAISLSDVSKFSNVQKLTTHAVYSEDLRAN